MEDTKFQLLNAPIIEAVLDLECDMPPGFDLVARESRSRELFRDKYPQFRKQFLQEHMIQAKPDQPPTMSVRHAAQSLQFLQQDGRQLVQVRAQGFSFNRLAPYSSLDDYFPEIQRTWGLFCSIADPVHILVVRLRYINRILLPTIGGEANLDDYLKAGPRLPDATRLTFTGFLDHHTAVEHGTGNQVAITLTAQPPENEKLPIILDITASANGPAEPENWGWILSKIQALRALKNSVFRNTLTERCLNLFQQP